MSKYKPRSGNIEALPVPESLDDIRNKWPPWARAAWHKDPQCPGSVSPRSVAGYTGVLVNTLIKSEVDALPGDYIIKKNTGDLIVMKADIFHTIYEEVEDA